MLLSDGFGDSHETCLVVSACSAVALLCMYLEDYLEIIFRPSRGCPWPLLLLEVCLGCSVVIIFTILIIKEPHDEASKLFFKPNHYKAN